MDAIQDITKYIESLSLNKQQATRLHRVAGNAMRRIITKNVRSQKNIDGTSMRGRKGTPTYINSKGRIVKNKKMFQKVPRFSRLEVSSNSTEVGFSGKVARIVRTHNEGMSENFRLPSGVINITMPKREFMGWNKEMQQEVFNSIDAEFLKLKR
jgi:phage virion morphogenesis protein